MKEFVGAGFAAGAIAVTAGGGASIVAEGWPEAALVALAVGAAFGLDGWFADRRLAAVLAVVRSFCEEAAVNYPAREDVRIADAEVRRITGAGPDHGLPQVAAGTGDPRQGGAARACGETAVMRKVEEGAPS